jgi:CubicO group peptidase (beta-lactamase class C family)
MRKWIKRLLQVIAGIVLLLVVIAIVVVGRQGASILSAHTSKVLCSAVFVSDRDPRDVMNEDLAQYSFMDTEVDREGESVAASLFGLAERRAIFRPCLGCTLVLGVSEADLRSQVSEIAGPGPAGDEIWPRGDLRPSRPWALGIDRAELNKAMDWAFQELNPDMHRRTRAVVVLYDGEIVAERYAPGYSKETRLVGWSMAKSVTGALIGILVQEGKLVLDQPVTATEWSNPEDPRREITLDQLMRMSSGLKFDEGYDSPYSDTLTMLYNSPDPAAYAAGLQLETAPDEKWSYSSGTTNILSRIVREAIGGSLTDYLTFPRRALFDKIDMRSAVMEPSASGNFVGSSFMYATARDWARFGLLYLQDGVWAGERILPEGWVDYSRTPTPKAPRGEYGAQWWLNVGAKNDPADRWLPHAPTDAYSSQGFEGQFVTVIPSRKLVIVRLGMSVPFEAWDHDAFVAQVVAAVN